MAYEQQEMSGTLFQERNKKNPKGPDWTGTVLIEGITWRLAAWTKQGQRGDFLSLKVSEQQPPSDRETAARGIEQARYAANGDRPKPPQSSAPAFDDDVPF